MSEDTVEELEERISDLERENDFLTTDLNKADEDIYALEGKMYDTTSLVDAFTSYRPAVEAIVSYALLEVDIFTANLVRDRAGWL